MSRIRHRRKSGRGMGGNLIFGILIIAVLYLVITGIAGKWVAKYVITPVFNTFNKTTEEKKGEDERTVTQNIKLDTGTKHFLQIGVYENEKNAEDQASLIRMRGAAGYILKSDKQYRVLAWAYDTESDAQQVKQQLMDSDKLSSEVFTEKNSSVTLKVTGRQEDVNTIKLSIERFESFLDRLKNVSLGLDKAELGNEAVLGELKKIKTETEDMVLELTDIQKNTDNSCVEELEKIYSSNLEYVKSMLKEPLSQTQLASGVKYVYVNMYYSYKNMINSLKA